jgi:2-methylcitrate dehydratase PrpD
MSKDEISTELRDKATLAILDYLGAIASGLQAPWAQHLVKYAKSRAGRNEAHVWGLQRDVPVETAAFVNSALAHR